jgi:hypothetical protein
VLARTSKLSSLIPQRSSSRPRGVSVLLTCTEMMSYRRKETVPAQG